MHPLLVQIAASSGFLVVWELLAVGIRVFHEVIETVCQFTS